MPRFVDPCVGLLGPRDAGTDGDVDRSGGRFAFEVDQHLVEVGVDRYLGPTVFGALENSGGQVVEEFIGDDDVDPRFANGRP